MRTRSLSALALCLGLSSTLALAQPPEGSAAPPRSEVTLDAGPLFASDSMGMAGTIALRVSLTNHTGRDLSGELLIQPEGWRERDLPQRVRVDLPAHQQRDVRVSLQVGAAAERVVLTYAPAGLRVQTASVPLNVRGDAGVVVLANPPRMRGHLFGMASAALSGTAPYALNFILAEASFAPESGDPLVPDEAAGWSNYPVVFAAVADAEKLEGAARRALLGHVQAGARVVLVPRRPEDCAAPIVRELLGRVTCSALDAEALPTQPSEHPWQRARRFLTTGDANVQVEPFGVSRPLGFGTAFLLGWDANAADADQNATQDVLHAVLQHQARTMRAQHALGRVPDDPTALRTALDPNESFRPALGMVAILLLLYVLAVGPLNFRYVERQGRPTVALLTTPLIALGCLLLMASAAYLSKGVSMRARVIDVLELPSGDTRGVRTRYVSYYLTRPRTFDAVPEAGARAMLLEADSAGRGVVAEAQHGGLALTGLRGGLWETIVTQEQSLLDTEGALRVDIRHDNLTQVTVVNAGRQRLLGAIYVSAAGEVYVLGDLAPGESRVQPTSLLAMLPDWELRMGRGTSSEVEATALAMGMPLDATPALRGAMSVMRPDASREGVWARVEGDGGGASSDGFALEWERRFVFVAARRDASLPLTVPQPPPTTGEPPTEGQVTP